MPESRGRHGEILRSRQNPRVQAARRIARDPRLARREGLLLADGITLVLEALDAGLRPRLLLIDPDDPGTGPLRSAASRRRARVTPASRAVVGAVSCLATPQGAVGIFERPVSDPAGILAAPDADRHPLLAVLHGLQDPSNVGSLIRTARAAGLTGIVTTSGTVDPFHPRAVRASMGASFRLPLGVDLVAGEVWSALGRAGYRVLALDPRGGIEIEALRADRSTALILGREGTGLDAETRGFCHGAVRIPMARDIESLGVAVAGGIAFYVLSGLLGSG